MSVSQRLSRGFHRLGLFVALIPLLVGAAATFFAGSDAVKSGRQSHQAQVELHCARSYYAEQYSKPNPLIEEMNRLVGIKPGSLEAMFGNTGKPIYLGDIGCAEERGKTASPEAVFYATEPAPFSRANALLPVLLTGLLISFAVASSVYGVIRAIGWVVGSFAAS